MATLGREIVNKYSVKIEGLDKINTLNIQFNEVSKKIDNAEKKAKSFGQSLKDNIFSYKGVAIATAGMLVKKSISDALDFNSIAIDIKKVKPSLEIDNIKKSLIELKKTAPGKSFEDLGLAYKFAVQNMKEEEVEGFLKIAEKSTIAFDMSAQETAESLTKLKTQYKLTNEEIMDFSDKTAYAHHKFGTASVANILRVQGNLAGMTQAMNVNKDSVLAWSTTLLQGGLDAGTVASSIENMITRLSSLKGGKARESLKIIGIDEEELKAGMKNNPAEMINKVLMKMGEAGKRKDVNIASISSSLFGLNYQSQAVYLTEKFKEMVDLQDKLQGKIRGTNKELVYQGEVNSNYGIKMSDDKMVIKSATDNLNRISTAIGEFGRVSGLFGVLRDVLGGVATGLETLNYEITQRKKDKLEMDELGIETRDEYEDFLSGKRSGMSSFKNNYAIGTQLPSSMMTENKNITKNTSSNNNYTFNIQGGSPKSIADEVLATIQQMNRNKDIMTQHITQ
jgi:TP901 family phage tail tape measure protein